MDDMQNVRRPSVLALIEQDTKRLGFHMASDPQTGSLLRTLAASKPGGIFLELGTGTGVATAWILDGMDDHSTLLSVDNDAAVMAVAKRYLGQDARVQFHTMDGAMFLQTLQGQAFDFVFADTWPGKYTHLDDVLQRLKPGGFYIIDDMLPQPQWPADHAPKVSRLITALEARDDLLVTKLNWATGIVIAVKRA